MTNSSDTNEDTNTGSDEYWTNLKKFLQTTISVIIFFIIYYFGSGFFLFLCKLAQSNILPTDLNCYPYTDNKPNIQTIDTNIFKTYSDPQMAMKLSFPYNSYNSSSKILDLFRSYKEDPSSSAIGNYFISIIESLISQNYKFINYIANIINGLPEVLIVIFAPIIFSILLFILFLYDHLYLIYLWFAKMDWFFKINANSEQSKKPLWVDVSLLNPISYFCAIILVLVFILLFFILLLGLPVLPLITVSWCIFSCLFYTGEMYGKSTSLLSIISQLFKYYKISFMTIISFFIIVSAFGTLGVLPGVFCVSVIVLIYFGVISIDLFKRNTEVGLTKVVSDEQAKKVCVIPSSGKKPTQHGVVYRLFSEIFSGQTGGTILTKELKDISKKMGHIKK